MPRPVIAWPPPGATAADVVAEVDVFRHALDGTGPAIATAGIIDTTRITTVPDEAAVVIGTSGTTGPPKPALLPASALLTGRSGAAYDGTGGPGQWLLAVPPSHITGLCVILRSIRAGYLPVPIRTGHFGPETFVEATRRLDPRAERHFTTLVPTQLRRILNDPESVAAAREYDHVLVGAAPLAAADRARAESFGINIIEGYGLSETAGGCIYEGVPLPGTHLRLEADDRTPRHDHTDPALPHGRICIGGPRVAIGYLDRPDAADDFHTDDAGIRWFRTSDHGMLDRDGKLRVLGRLDDIINTGGFKVAPIAVEEAIAHVRPRGVAEALVIGTPHPEWGETVTALVVPTPDGPPTLTELRAALADHLPGHALPGRIHLVDALPLVGPAKPDRVRARQLLAAADHADHDLTATRR